MPAVVRLSEILIISRSWKSSVASVVALTSGLVGQTLLTLPLGGLAQVPVCPLDGQFGNPKLSVRSSFGLLSSCSWA